MPIDDEKITRLMTPEHMLKIFPESRADQFFEALLGDAEEGAYDISLAFSSMLNGRLQLAFQLKQRPGKCLACNLTHGLPHVFGRHPVINVQGVVDAIDAAIAGIGDCGDWQIGVTEEIAPDLHQIPLTIDIEG